MDDTIKLSVTVVSKIEIDLGKAIKNTHNSRLAEEKVTEMIKENDEEGLRELLTRVLPGRFHNLDFQLNGYEDVTIDTQKKSASISVGDVELINNLEYNEQD